MKSTRRIRLSRAVNPKTQILNIGIKAKHIKDTDFNDVTNCAVAKAVREQLDAPGILVDTFSVDFFVDGEDTEWFIMGYYTEDDFLADTEAIKSVKNPNQIIRYIKLERII